MLRFLPWVLLAGCSGGGAGDPALRRFDEVTLLVLDAFGNARHRAMETKLIHFLVLRPDAFVVYKDVNRDARLDPAADTAVLSLKADLTERGLLLEAADWYASDGEGRTAWSSPGILPPEVVIRDPSSGARVEFKIHDGQLRVAKVAHYGRDGK